MTGACTTRQEGDEKVCVCGLRWDTKDERPACPSQPHRLKLTSTRALRKALKILSEKSK